MGRKVFVLYEQRGVCNQVARGFEVTGGITTLGSDVASCMLVSIPTCEAELTLRRLRLVTEMLCSVGGTFLTSALFRYDFADNVRAV